MERIKNIIINLFWNYMAYLVSDSYLLYNMVRDRNNSKYLIKIYITNLKTRLTDKYYLLKNIRA